MGFAREVGDRVLFMDDGIIVEKGRLRKSSLMHRMRGQSLFEQDPLIVLIN